MIAVAFKRIDVLRLLCKHEIVNAFGPDEDGNCPIVFACENNMAEFVKVFFDEGGVDLTEEIRWMWISSGRTLFKHACLSGADTTVKLLLKQKNLDVNEIDGRNKTIFYHVCTGGNTHIAKLLLNDERVLVNNASRFNHMENVTAYQRMCYNGTLEMLKLLQSSNRIDVNIKSKTTISIYGQLSTITFTPFIVVINRSFPFMKVLLDDPRIDISIPDSSILQSMRNMYSVKYVRHVLIYILAHPLRGIDDLLTKGGYGELCSPRMITVARFIRHIRFKRNLYAMRMYLLRKRHNEYRPDGLDSKAKEVEDHFNSINK